MFKNNKLVKEIELKLVTEIKERADQKIRNPKESPTENAAVVVASGICHDPVAQLVTELSESLNLDRDYDSNVRKSSQGSVQSANKTCSVGEGNNTTFLPHLKKTEQSSLLKKSNPSQNEKSDTNDTSIIIDFKSRLRKVDNCSEKGKNGSQEEDEKIERKASSDSDELVKRQSTASSDSGNLKIEEGDDKRKSTGSISSLKKIWETKEASDSSTNIQLSPKLSMKNYKNEEIEASCVDTSDDSIKMFKEKRIWPPGNEDKPLIPTKPPVKAMKPVIGSRPTGSAIYATPIPTTANSKPPISAKPISMDTKTPEDDVKITTITTSYTTDKSGKENIIEISQALETTLNSIKANPTVSTTSWLQLSDKIGLLHTSCMDYADNVVPAHTKFHFRELLTRLESQARQLRSAGTRNTSENVRYLNEVMNTIKDVVNVVLR